MDIIKKPKMSVCIPTSDMADKYNLFKRCLNSLWNQSFQDFEIVVTDNSEDDVIERICDWYKAGIRYYRNPIKGMAQNTNEAIKKSKGELIKILYMDDYLTHDDALLFIVNSFTKGWLVTGCLHDYNGMLQNPHHAMYNNKIYTGNNTIGSPSVLTIENKNPLLFDENMTWLLDCDYFYRLYQRYGEPTVLDDLNVIMGLHEAQATHTMGDDRKIWEQEYLMKKYEHA